MDTYLNDAINVILKRLEDIERHLPGRTDQSARDSNPPSRPYVPRTWSNSNYGRDRSIIQNRGVRSRPPGTRYNHANSRNNPNWNRGASAGAEARLNPEI